MKPPYEELFVDDSVVSTQSCRHTCPRSLQRTARITWAVSSGPVFYALSSRLILSATGQIPDVGEFALIDRDTPQSAYTHTSIETGEAWELVFSDEFNQDGRTFWPGESYHGLADVRG